MLGMEAESRKTVLCAFSAPESMPESKMEEFFWTATKGIKGGVQVAEKEETKI